MRIAATFHYHPRGAVAVKVRIRKMKALSPETQNPCVLDLWDRKIWLPEPFPLSFCRKKPKTFQIRRSWYGYGFKEFWRSCDSTLDTWWWVVIRLPKDNSTKRNIHLSGYLFLDGEGKTYRNPPLLNPKIPAVLISAPIRQSYVKYLLLRLCFGNFKSFYATIYGVKRSLTVRSTSI